MNFEELVELIRAHIPLARFEPDLLVECVCGQRFFSDKSWSRHLAEEVKLLERRGKT